MNSIAPGEIREALEKLAGQQAPLKNPLPESAVRLLDPSTGSGLGYSQLNEVLLILGFDRVAEAFFQYLIDETTAYEPGSAIDSIESLRQGIERFRRLALLAYGNVKFAFKMFSQDTERLEYWLNSLEPVPVYSYAIRHQPVDPIQRIPGEHTKYLGYLIQQQLDAALQESSGDAGLHEEDELRADIVRKGQHNHNAYLASDHLDVYVATSMREAHEFVNTSALISAIFDHKAVADLNIRWFDPTQAYCENRIDKGLVEALMLKRAQCTVYLAQETDTFGKDSELASTLAQGKPVIAYVPEASPTLADDLLQSLERIYPKKPRSQLILEQLELFDPGAAWRNERVKTWLSDSNQLNLTEATELLQETMESHYTRRAQTLRESHPLGIQVNLRTGVANGVLVVRTVAQCAELISRIVTQSMVFELEERDDGYIVLKEEVSDSIFRVMTSDAMLTNSFWNYYLELEE